MGVTMSVENVPEEVAAKLEQRAKRSRRSLQGELMVILTRAASETEQLSPQEVLEKVRALGLRTPSESAAFVRQDRDAH